MLDPNFDPLKELEINRQRINNLEILVNEMLKAMENQAKYVKLLSEGMNILHQRQADTEHTVKTLSGGS